MAVFTPLQSLWSATIYTTVAPVILVFLICSLTYIYTNLRYRFQVWQHKHRNGRNVTPILLPYTVPFIGNALKFLTRKPGYFYEYLLSFHPRATGTATLMMGGRSMHLLFDTYAIQAMIKARDPNRDAMNFDISIKGFGAEKSEMEQFYGLTAPPQEAFGGKTPREQQEHVYTNYLLRTDRVNELTGKFMEVFRSQLSSESQAGEKSREIGLYSWLRPRMFKASTDALFGCTLLEDYPDLEEDFFEFDISFLECYFGIPRWLSPKPYEVRDRLTTKMKQWQQKNIERTKGQIADPDGDIDWEPIRGSRINRMRQVYYESRGLNLDTRARMDLGMLFGLSSNAIPATGWILMHILDPNGDKTLYPRAMQEINTARRPDGSFDVPTLAIQPLLLSMVHEVLRLYVDTLITRELPKDLIVPLGTKDKLTLSKGSIVVAPTWLEHRENSYWPGAPADTFYAERFLTTDPDSGKTIFTTSTATGKIMAFGGGKTICPGRTFAKQEILASVAMVLSEFEFEGLGYLDADGKEAKQFPGLKDLYPGSATMVAKGDINVRIKRKN